MIIKSILKKIFPSSFVLWSHKVRGVLAALIFGFPAKKMKIIGVTGTNGKTTTCHIIANILEEAGFTIGMVSTIRFRIAKEEIINSTNMTTVSPFVLQKMLKKMKRAKCQYAIVETTSHAISQFRNWGINYEAAILTNITHEHLDYHKTFTNYKNAKLKFFKDNKKIHIINIDDPSSSDFLKLDAYQKFTYSVQKNKKADLRAENIVLEHSGSKFDLITPIGQETIALKLPGFFNISNSLAASALAISQGMGMNIIKKGLEKIKNIPGRMEKIETNSGFQIIIDYAHTPDALEKIYQTLTPIAKSRIISVLGACGDRDKTKRPILGALAGRFADLVIVTNEEQYTEDPEKIIAEVAGGVPRGASKHSPKILNKNFWKISDRREAIQKALSEAKKGDIVLITGMGDQRYMTVGHKHLPWSDREVVKEELNKINSKIKNQNAK